MPKDPDSDFVDYVSARMARLHRVAYFMCGDAHRAEDLVQATLVSLYAGWKSAKSADNLDAYVHRILARRFIDEKRSAWSRVLLRDRLPDTVKDPDNTFTERDAIVAALRTVPVGQRAVIALRYYSDLSVEQTAAALGCSTGTVKSQCARGLATFRAALGLAESDGDEPNPQSVRRTSAPQPVVNSH